MSKKTKRNIKKRTERLLNQAQAMARAKCRMRGWKEGYKAVHHSCLHKLLEVKEIEGSLASVTVYEVTEDQYNNSIGETKKIPVIELFTLESFRDSLVELLSQTNNIRRVNIGKIDLSLFY